MPKNRDHYIQIDKDLMDDPLLLEAATRVYCDEAIELQHSTGEALSEEEGMQLSRARYVSALLRLWCYADTYINDDDTLPLSEIPLEQYVGLKGFCKHSPPEWLQVLPDGRIKLPGYCEKNDVVGRRLRKAQRAEYMRNWRNGSRDDHTTVTKDSRKKHVPLNTNTYTKEEKRVLTNPKKKGADDRKREAAMQEALLTPGLNADAFRRFVAFRDERKPRVITASLIALAERLAGFGDARTQDGAVREAIANGWQGVQPPKVNGSAAPRAWTGRPTQESALAAIEAASRLTDIEQGDSPYVIGNDEPITYDN